jgi:hypothetical protein
VGSNLLVFAYSYTHFSSRRKRLWKQELELVLLEHS